MTPKRKRLTLLVTGEAGPDSGSKRKRVLESIEVVDCGESDVRGTSRTADEHDLDSKREPDSVLGPVSEVLQDINGNSGKKQKTTSEWTKTFTEQEGVVSEGPMSDDDAEGWEVIGQLRVKGVGKV